MNNGNGKVDPRVVTAQQAVEAALKPFRDAEKRAATTRLRLSEAETVLANAEQAYDAAQDAYVENDSAVNGQRLRQTHDAVQSAKSRVEGFRKKLAAEEGAIVPLKAAHDAAMVALAEAQAEANLTHLEEEWSTARHVLDQLETQLITARQTCADAERRYKILATQRRDAQQERERRDAAVRFRKLNPEPGFLRQRQGFGL